MNVRGGLIGEIPYDRLSSIRDPRTIPPVINKLIDIMTLSPSSRVQHYGSYFYGIVPYPSDIDTMCYTNVRGPEEAKSLMQDVVKRVAAVHGWNPQRIPSGRTIFSELKCGTDDMGVPLRWTLDEVLAGIKETDAYDYDLGDSILQLNGPAACKIEMIAPVNGRYVDFSMVYYVSVDGVPTNYVPLGKHDLINGLKIDISELLEKGNLFKALKRIYAIARMTKDQYVMSIVAPVLNSNVAKLGNSASMLNTIKLMADRGLPVKPSIINNTISSIMFQLSSIQDITIDLDYMLQMLGDIEEAVRNNSKPDTIRDIGRYQIYTQKITSREVEEYLESKGITSFNDFGPNYITPDVLLGGSASFTRGVYSRRIPNIPQYPYTEMAPRR